MRLAVVTAAMSLALAACVAEETTQPYAFVGTWECEEATFNFTFTFTNTSYNNGTETYAIRAVDQDGRNYTLYMVDGFLVGLGAVTDTGMTWVSGTTGDQFNCRRV